jgi:uncharacterized RDD family membrane protein YckC
MIAPPAISRGRTNSLVIRLPEGVDFALPLAGPLSRFLALSVDFAAYAAICSVVGRVLGIFGFFSADIARAALVLAYFVVPIAYGITCEWLMRGQTLGKRLLRLRVMDATGLRLRFSQILMRNLLRAVDSLPALYLVGGAVCLVSRRGQRLGDLAAGTVVVRLPEERTTDLAALGLQFKFNSLREHPVLAARLRQRVPPAVAAIALRALLRREQLDPEPRLEIFRELAAQMKALVPYPEDVTADLSDEAYVRNVVEIVFQSSALASSGKRAIMPTPV